MGRFGQNQCADMGCTRLFQNSRCKVERGTAGHDVVNQQNIFATQRGSLEGRHSKCAREIGQPLTSLQGALWRGVFQAEQGLELRFLWAKVLRQYQGLVEAALSQSFYRQGNGNQKMCL